MATPTSKHEIDEGALRVAQFLKDRDEAFIVSEEQTDDERLESAREIIRILSHSGEESRTQGLGDRADALVDQVARAILDGFTEGNQEWHEATWAMRRSCEHAAKAVLATLSTPTSSNAAASNRRDGE